MTLKLSGFDRSFLKAVDRALSLKAKDRPQNVQEFQKDIVGELRFVEEKLPSEEKRNTGLYIIIASFLLLVLFGGYYYSTEYSQATLAVQENKVKVNSDNDNMKEKMMKERK